MGKEKFDVSNIVGQKVTNTEDLGNGYVRITFNDGTMIVAQVVPLAIKVASEKTAAPAKEGKAAKGKAKAQEEEEEEDEEEEITIEEMREALIEAGEDKKKVKKMTDEEVEEAYDELEEEEDEEEDDEDDEDDEEEEEDDDEDDEDDSLTADDIRDADFDDLEDIIDDQELEIDIEDYDAKKPKDLEKLRKEVAKALKIKL